MGELLLPRPAYKEFKMLPHDMATGGAAIGEDWLSDQEDRSESAFCRLFLGQTSEKERELQLDKITR